MSLIAKSTSFDPPPEGVWPAVCVDIVDMGMISGTWGQKHKCRIVWELSEKMDDGKPYLASGMYTVTLTKRLSCTST